MDRDKLKDAVLERSTELLQRDASGKGWVCPACGDGDGAHGKHGMTSKDGGRHFTCWRCGTFQNADIFDIIGEEYNLPDFPSRLNRAAELLGYSDVEIGNQNQPRTERNTQNSIHNTQYTTSKDVEIKDFLLQAQKNLEKTDYHRGISLETLRKFGCGYVEAWKHPKAPDRVPFSPRLIIPTSEESYIARDTRPNLTDEQKEYEKSKVGSLHFLNVGALQNAETPIFLTEGEIDAMSIIDVGGEAMALGTTTMTKKFLSLVEEQKPVQPLILALDNDDAGNAGMDVLEEGLKRLKVPYYRVNIYGDKKDANEALNADRDTFRSAVEKAKAVELYRESAASSLQGFIQRIVASKNAACVSTGFAGLDSIIDGGLYAGLYIVGAISSLGKTTFTLQICDQVAQAGRDVLIFSLEMARDELIAKSISRLTLLEDMERNGSTAHAKTTRGILSGSRYDSYSSEEMAVIKAAMGKYGDYADRIYITEGMGDVGVEQIREKVAKHTRIKGKPPVVLIDYLQILAPADPRASDKQNVDKAVLELKRLSRDYGIPVIGISSFNRENYTEPVNLTSFKESGAVEYSSDVLIGLQYDGMDYKRGESATDRAKRIRDLVDDAVEAGRTGRGQKIQVKVLKNRNGSKGQTQMTFTPMFNLFQDEEKTSASRNWKTI